MRTIKFRGITVDTRKWVEGYVFQSIPNTERVFILADNSPYNDEIELHGEKKFVAEDYHEVLPESVGMFTGLLDKDGREIWEGDVLAKSSNAQKVWVVYWYNLFQKFTAKQLVADITHVNDDGSEVYGFVNGTYSDHSIDGLLIYDNVVIGTIHDHLLKPQP